MVSRRLTMPIAGAEVDRAGDGFLARFDAPRHQAVRLSARDRAARTARLVCALARPSTRGKSSSRTGRSEGSPCILISRLTGLASPGEVLVSSTVRDLRRRFWLFARSSIAAYTPCTEGRARAAVRYSPHGLNAGERKLRPDPVSGRRPRARVAADELVIGRISPTYGERPPCLPTGFARALSLAICRSAAHEFELLINLKTAKALGLAIPSRSWRADQVIESAASASRRRTALGG